MSFGKQYVKRSANNRKAKHLNIENGDKIELRELIFGSEEDNVQMYTMFRNGVLEKRWCTSLLPNDGFDALSNNLVINKKKS